MNGLVQCFFFNREESFNEFQYVCKVGDGLLIFYYFGKPIWLM